MTGALTKLRDQANALSARGRHGDTELLHVSKDELSTLRRMSPTGELTINPDTGLPEAFGLGSILGSLGGALLPVLFPGVGDTIGGALGLTDMLGPDLGAAIGGGLAGGGLGLLGTMLGGGSTKDYLLAGGLGALGGGLTSYFSPEISGFLGTGGNAGGLLSPLFGGGEGGLPIPPVPPEGGAAGATWASGAGGLGGAAGAGSSAAASGSSWLGRNWPLLAGGLLLAGMAGGSKDPAKPPPLTQAQKDQQAQNGAHAQNYTFSRAPALLDPTQWYTLGNQNTGKPVLFFDNPAGTYTPTAGPIQGLARGGQPQAGLSALRASRYVNGPDGGQDDTVPARLSDGEYVMDATTVSDLGDGNNKAGAQKLDQMRVKLAKQKGRRQVVPPKARAASSYIGRGA